MSDFECDQEEEFMAFCQKCGTQLTDDAQFCPACGQMVDTASIPEAPSSQAAVPQPQYQPPQPQYAAPQPPSGPQYQPPQPGPDPQPQPGPQYAPPQPQPGSQYQPPQSGPQYAPPQPQYQPPQSGPGQQYQPFAPAGDAEANKAMAILAYIIFFIPLLTGDYKKSPFVKYHTNQGTILFIASMIFAVAYSIVTGVLSALILRSFALWGVWSAISTILGLLWLAPTAGCIYGIVNAATGKMKPIPLIGDKYTIIK